MDFAQIWVILKAESCWAALILYRIKNITDTATRACIAIESPSRNFLIGRNLADFVSFVCFLGTPIPAALPTADVIYGSPLRQNTGQCP